MHPMNTIPDLCERRRFAELVQIFGDNDVLIAKWFLAAVSLGSILTPRSIT